MVLDPQAAVCIKKQSALIPNGSKGCVDLRMVLDQQSAVCLRLGQPLALAHTSCTESACDFRGE
jgi:hypothetical protein